MSCHVLSDPEDENSIADQSADNIIKTKTNLNHLKKRKEIIPWLNDPLADAIVCNLLESPTARSASTVTDVFAFRMLTLMFSGIPGRKLVGDNTRYELKGNDICINSILCESKFIMFRFRL